MKALTIPLKAILLVVKVALTSYRCTSSAFLCQSHYLDLIHLSEPPYKSSLILSFPLHYFPCVVDKPLLIIVKMIDPIYIFIDSRPLEQSQLKDSSYLVQSHTLSKDIP